MRIIFLAGTLLTLGCASEIDNKPAATVEDIQAAPEGTQQKEVKQPADITSDGEQAVWQQSETSKIEWVGAKVSGDHTGGFETFETTIEMEASTLKSISVSIDVNSMYSDNDRLTSHLLSDDFFDVKKFATATFKSTAIEEKSVAGATHLIKGELDLHGVKKALAFPATVETADGVQIKAEFTINRMLWGIIYPGKTDDLIKEDVLIKSNFAFVN